MATESAEGETTVVEGLYMAEEEEGDLTWGVEAEAEAKAIE